MSLTLRPKLWDRRFTEKKKQLGMKSSGFSISISHILWYHTTHVIQTALLIKQNNKWRQKENYVPFKNGKVKQLNSWEPWLPTQCPSSQTDKPTVAQSMQLTKLWTRKHHRCYELFLIWLQNLTTCHSVWGPGPTCFGKAQACPCLVPGPEGRCIRFMHFPNPEVQGFFPQVLLVEILVVRLVAHTVHSKCRCSLKQRKQGNVSSP